MGLKERRQRERDARREMILGAARELLHEKGLNGASMNQIARRAELGVATLYSYFTNKEHLFVTLQAEGFALLQKKLIKAVKGISDPAEKLRVVAQTYLNFSLKNRNYYYIINYFASTPEILFQPDLKVEVDAMAAQPMKLPQEIIEEGVTAGIFKETNTRHAGIMFSGLLQGLTQYKKLEKTVFDGDSFTEIFAFAIHQFIESLK